MIPASLPRFAPVPGETTNFVPIEYLIELFADLLFPGFAIRARGVFRIIRDSDIEIEEAAEDLVRLFRTEIRRRRRGRVIRTEERRAGKDGVSTCRSRGTAGNTQK